MKRDNFLKILLIFLFWTMPVVADDHDEAKMLRDSDVIVSLEKVIEDALKRKPGKVIGTELEKKKGRYVYEIEVLDDNHNVWELLYDAQDGSLLKQEMDD